MLHLCSFAHQPITFARMYFLVNAPKRFKTSQNWIRRQQTDPYDEKAKINKYRCGSAFKLIELNDRTNILTPGLSVINLGAAPGSWTQVAVQKTNADGVDSSKPKGKVLSIDKQYIFPIDGATIISNIDFSTIEAQDKVLKALDGNKVDVVLLDMISRATDLKELNKDRILGLCYMALRFAALVTKIDGNFVCKVWDCKEIYVLVMDLKRFFRSVEIMKPLASRQPPEKFILARGFKGVQRPLKNGRWG